MMCRTGPGGRRPGVVLGQGDHLLGHGSHFFGTGDSGLDLAVLQQVGDHGVA